MSQQNKENQQCWILKYNATFENLVFPKHFYNKIQYFIKDKSIPTNLMIVGGNGFGKSRPKKLTFFREIILK